MLQTSCAQKNPHHYFQLEFFYPEVICIKQYNLHKVTVPMSKKILCSNCSATLLVTFLVTFLNFLSGIYSGIFSRSQIRFTYIILIINHNSLTSLIYLVVTMVKSPRDRQLYLLLSGLLFYQDNLIIHHVSPYVKFYIFWDIHFTFSFIGFMGQLFMILQSLISFSSQSTPM